MQESRDKEIRERVQQVLDTNSESREYGLKADVINGEAIITGIVDSLSEKESISRIVSGINGVRRVENGLAISTDGAINDEAVTFEVMEELNADPNVNLKHVGARSVRGTVFLKGRVESKEEIDTAVKAAAKARGVRNVVSQLSMETARELSLEEIFHSQVNNDKEEKEKSIYKY
ncbi:BON domain-containing protein [Pelotomaculum propionicicum]|uniref:BON domain-containing protein n=1 Tax=Pelotomaculum propionicicum TaxID=258475 RepID=UPI003B80DD08